jgi:hypothetical protein
MTPLRAFNCTAKGILGIFLRTVARDLRAFANGSGEGPRIFLAPLVGAFRAARTVSGEPARPFT